MLADNNSAKQITEAMEFVWSSAFLAEPPEAAEAARAIADLIAALEGVPSATATDPDRAYEAMVATGQIERILYMLRQVRDMFEGPLGGNLRRWYRSLDSDFDRLDHAVGVAIEHYRRLEQDLRDFASDMEQADRLDAAAADARRAGPSVSADEWLAQLKA